MPSIRFREMEERDLKQGIRISHENFSRYGNIQVLPIYAVSRLLESG